MATQGYGSPAAEQAYRRAEVLCHQIGDQKKHFSILIGLRMFYHVSGSFKVGYELGEQCLTLAQGLEDDAILAIAHLHLGHTSYFQGQLVTARSHVEQALAYYDLQQHGEMLDFWVIDVGVQSLILTAWILWLARRPMIRETTSKCC